MYNVEHHNGLCLLSSVLEGSHERLSVKAVTLLLKRKSPVTNLAAWIASTFLMFSVVCGSHTVAAYST